MWLNSGTVMVEQCGGTTETVMVEQCGVTVEQWNIDGERVEQ